MPQQAAMIESLPEAFEVVKAMQADGLEWGEGYRPLGRQALADVATEGSAVPPRRTILGLLSEGAGPPPHLAIGRRGC